MNWNNRNRSLLSMPFFKGIGIILFLTIAMGIAGHFDREAEEAELDHYCEMVKLFKEDKAAGIPAHDRRGWPEFKKGEVTCP